MKKTAYRISKYGNDGRYAVVFKMGSAEKVVVRTGSLMKARAYVEGSESKTKGIKYVYDTVEGKRVIL